MNSPRYQAAPGAVPPPPRRRSEFLVQLDHFWQKVTEGLELSQLWKQFQSDARTSYRLYQKDFSTRSLQEARQKGFFQTAQEFAWAILEKLTPARRVLLIIGVILLIFPGGGFEYHNRAGELQVAEFDFHFFGGILLFVLLMLEIADRVVMKRDLEIARDIQKWLLPAAPPQVSGLQIAFATRPANTVAGDYYDVFARPAENADQKYLFTVADVAGKSMPAALLMATFQASLKTLSSVPCALIDLVVGMNHYASSNSQSGLRFITAFLAEFDPTTRTLAYVNAGHNPPILRRSTGAIEHLTAGGVPLGINSAMTYTADSVSLAPGDWLVIFTDGLVEAINANGVEYDEQRVLNVLQLGVNATPDELLRRMMSDLDAFVGDTPQHDDVTCLLVKMT
jgi:hypothetical protein